MDISAKIEEFKNSPNLNKKCYTVQNNASDWCGKCGYLAEKMGNEWVCTKCFSVVPYPAAAPEPVFVDLLKEVIKWVEDPKNKALGLAAPQIGDNRTWFVMKMGETGPAFAVINPRIIGKLERKKYVEKCFSSEGHYKVKRWKEIDVEFTDIEGMTSKLHLSGQAAQIFQHEMSHLLGKTLATEGKLIKDDD